MKPEGASKLCMFFLFFYIRNATLGLDKRQIQNGPGTTVPGYQCSE